MAKSLLKVDTHLVNKEDQAVEIWYEGIFIATVYGADGPGVRVVTKYPIDIVRGGMGERIKVIEIRIEMV